ncbi:hypothetical protein ACT17_06120 [Mycolicibacterium conceptionense]|uniref:SsDNA binding protein n=1 Tax=Mycolicibacterium conceptionense TaxID=451644 RepID=A0A0J8UDY5_9MYCO|nr:hypothetical protein [Mycolicibacterium conceptionense]KMV19713.1 hypothetical protein ACT17_06120 [Mycolicibacterium conceptionense]
MTTAVKYQGKTYQVHGYVDPYPGKKPTDRIYWTEDCWRCGGTGIFKWWTSVGLARGTCFGCGGARTVERSRAVSSYRREARVDAVLAEYGDQIAAEHAEKAAAAEAERLAEEIAQAWEEAHAEQARRAALNNEPVGTEKERLRDLDAVVEVSSGFERSGYAGGTEYCKIVVFKLPSGQMLKCMGTADALYGLDRGDRVKVTGTVKGLDEYKGQVQTVILRPKVEVIEKVEATA